MICVQCNNDLDDDNFAWRSKSRAIRQKRCKQCHKDYSKEHYKHNKESYLKKARIRNADISEENKYRLLQYLLDHPCVDCGETDPLVLEFDHVEGVGAGRVTALISYSWDTVVQEISKCQIRCSNCHTRVTHKRANSWRYQIINEYTRR